MVLDTPLRNTQLYKVRIKENEAIQGKKKRLPKHLGVVAFETGAFGMPTLLLIVINIFSVFHSIFF